MAPAPEPKLRWWIVGLFGTAGIVVLSLSMAAEGTRATTYTFLKDVEQKPHCHYPTHKASTLGFAASGITFDVLFFVTWLVGCLMFVRGPRYGVTRLNNVCNISIIAAWIFCSIACTLLVLAAVEEQYHTLEIGGSFSDLKCSVVPPGLFSGGGIAGLFSILACTVYYVCGMKVRWELWRTAESYASTSQDAEVDPKKDGLATTGGLPPVQEEAV